MILLKIKCILFAFFVIASLFDLSESLNCYVCNSTSPDCNDPFTRNSKYLKNCDGGLCFKLKTESVIQRGCGISCIPNSDLRCCTLEECNSSNSFKTNVFFYLIGLSTFLFLIKLF
ncbi:unnamed protein product [Brachionus calyciflorus]|uniref:Uncharacterized protein n=1 Tax=Brachionus calyciflorus TaxID=104777 RepID=A0A814R442_9BILA|nr:unnamed protein product [Brachionus calyciflorus]